MAFQRDLELDDVRDPDILAAYAERRLAFRPGLGPVHCPHCNRGVGLLLPGNALGRTAAARTLLVICTAEFARAAEKRGDVALVVPKVRKGSNSGLQEALDAPADRPDEADDGR